MGLDTVAGLGVVVQTAAALGAALLLGVRLTPAAVLARGALLTAALASLFGFGVYSVFGPYLLWLAVVAAAVSNTLMMAALRLWRGQPAWQKSMWVLPAVIGLVQALQIEGWVASGWSMGLLALQLALVANAAWQGAWDGGFRWRSLLGVCYLGLASVVAVPALVDVGTALHIELFGSWKFVPHVAQGLATACTVLACMGVMAACQRETSRMLDALAHSDPLTGLLNRRGWKKFAKVAIAQARRQKLSMAVLLIDLDHFKHVNDVHGHAAGDRALAMIGRAIKSCIRESDVAGRQGGEEFVVLLSDIDQHNAEMLDQRVRETFKRLSGEKLGLVLNFSSGLAFCDFRREDPLKRAVAEADAAMYHAKSRGRGQLCATADLNVTVPDELLM